jgi:hypothetical protein
MKTVSMITTMINVKKISNKEQHSFSKKLKVYKNYPCLKMNPVTEFIITINPINDLLAPVDSDMI